MKPHDNWTRIGAGSLLVIEFVPESATQVGRSLSSHRDDLRGYTRSGCEHALMTSYAIDQVVHIRGQKHTSYLMRRHART